MLDYTFGSLLKQLRRRTNLSQRDLAAALGIDRTLVAHWEEDSGRPPTAETLGRISALLQLNNIEQAELLQYASPSASGRNPEPPTTQQTFHVGKIEAGQVFQGGRHRFDKIEVTAGEERPPSQPKPAPKTNNTLTQQWQLIETNLKTAPLLSETQRENLLALLEKTAVSSHVKTINQPKLLGLLRLISEELTTAQPDLGMIAIYMQGIDQIRTQAPPEAHICLNYAHQLAVMARDYATGATP